MRTVRILLLLLLMLTPVGADTATGKFRVSYAPSQSAFGQQMEALLKQNRGFEMVANGLNGVFRLPHDIEIVFGEIGVVNAYYQPSTRRILMGYELINYFLQFFQNQGHTGENLGTYAMGATIFVFLHELGHALIHQLDLPITGREEDAADEFAILVLLEIGEEGKVAATAAALWLYAAGQQGGVSEMAFWDEHSLNQQRAYDILINLYAADPVNFAFLEQNISRDRLERGVRDLERKNKAWEALLAPHINQ